MLDFMRKKKRSIIIVFIFFAIIIVFVFWGVGPGPNTDTVPRVVARVDGTKISNKEYTRLYRRQVEYYRNAFKGGSDEFLRGLNLRKRTLDLLINRLLILKQAEREGVDVTDREVQDAIMKIRDFQRDGVFDKELYFRVLSANRIKPAEFEEDMRKDIIIRKMQDRVLKDVTVTDEEVRDTFSRENRQISLEYLTIDTDGFKDSVEVKEDEVKDFFLKNRSSFLIPTRIKAIYGRIRLDDIKDKIDIKEEDIKNYYEKNIIDFQTPKMIHARHILIRPEGGEDGRDRARKKIEEILERLKKGEDFAELAKNHSQDPGSAPKGGDLGWFPRGVMVRPFEDTAFSLKKGEISGVVETDFGFHIIKVEDIKEAGLIPYNEAKERIKKTLTEERIKRRARQRLAKLRTPLKEIDSLDELKGVGEEIGVEIFQTPLFSEDERGVELASRRKVKEAVFLLKEGQMSNIIEEGRTFYLVRVTQRVEAHLPEYDEVREKVLDRYKREKAFELAKKRAEEILKAVKEGEDFKTIASKDGMEIKSTGFFTKRDGFVPDIGVFVADRDGLFELTDTSPYYPEVLSSGGRFFVVRLKESKDARPEDFEKQKDSIKQRLLTRKKNEVLTRWIEDLRSKARIEINEEML